MEKKNFYAKFSKSVLLKCSQNTKYVQNDDISDDKRLIDTNRLVKKIYL